MALPTPNLDDRKFQDIVDEAKRMIPRFCPEWTDHNVSDPGVALIELFAWMTEMLLYRVNQVPDKNYIKFLELIGVRLQAPTPATGRVTFYLTAPATKPVRIGKETEVATVRTTTNQAQIFTVRDEFEIHAVDNTVIRGFTRDTSGIGLPWIEHNLRELGLPGKRLALFPESPQDGDGFYLQLDNDYSNHVLALVCRCAEARPRGINPDNPPRDWQVWKADAQKWLNCTVEYDGTRGFTETIGEIILHLPEMKSGAITISRSGPRSSEGYWLRCRVTVDKVDQGRGSYDFTPALEALRIEARGGAPIVQHGVTVVDEVLGTSDGIPGQTFKLLNVPVLSLDPDTDYLEVTEPGGKPEKWIQREDFAESNHTDPHYTLDALDGTITLGPALLQPGGLELNTVSKGALDIVLGSRVYSFGKVPVKGSLMKFKRYRYGGGEQGNVAVGTISVLKSAHPDIARLSNRQETTGGRDAESIAHAKQRAPLALRTRERAVTVDDYEFLALQNRQVARARCIAPGAQPGSPDAPRPGQVIVAILPQVNNPVEPAIDQMTLSAEVRNSVLNMLREKSVIGITPDVQPPVLTWVYVEATLRASAGSDPALVAHLRREAEQRLRKYLNPYVGGPRQEGWPFGRDLYKSEIFGLLQGIPSVEFVEDVKVYQVNDPNNLAGARTEVGSKLTLRPTELICSIQHQVVAK